MKRLSTEGFVIKSRLKHGDKYDYSQSDYKSSRKLIVIGCPIHGMFSQIAWNHLAGWGCPDCGGTKKLTTDQFVQRSMIRHGDKYDYSLANYMTDRSKVLIVCPTHGMFAQRPADHLNGRGCPKCGGTGKSDIKEFVDKARTMHGDKYDYSLVVYHNDATKVEIVCPLHGAFKQTPNSHLGGHGCDRCGGTAQLTTTEFIEKAILIHGNKYDYSRVNYKSSHVKVEILCPVHGLFLQRPNGHLFGRGCPKCKESNGEREIRKWLEQRGVSYKYQHRFPSCKHRLPLPFDFVVDLHGLLAIEYQGEQHFRPVGFGGNAEMSYHKVCRNDDIKRNWCKDNGVRLIEISYRDLDRVCEILDDCYSSSARTKLGASSGSWWNNLDKSSMWTCFLTDTPPAFSATF